MLKHFDFTLKDNAKILELKKVKDLEKLPKVKIKEELKFLTDDMNLDIDFEKIKEDYDAIMLWINSDDTVEFFNNMYFKMYGWDVDTLLVLNPDIVIEVEE